MTNGLNRNDMNWITRDCKERASIQQLWEIVKVYQHEIERRDTGEDKDDYTEDYC